MKNKMKRVLMMCFINFMIIICLSGCSATNTGEIIENKPFYSLQAAYNNEMISKKCLHQYCSIILYKCNKD